IRECLERGLAVHANQPPGSPWFALANFPNQEIAELFISKLENINVTNLNGRHLLHELCLQSLDLNLAELLLSREIGVDSLDSISATPLFYAAGGCQTAISHEDYKKRANVIRALLKAGANPRKLFFDYANQVGNSTVLHIVVSLGNYDAAKALLQFAPDLVNMPNALGEVPLHIAARNKDMDLLDLLLSQPGVAMHRQNQANQTAFELLAGNDESSKAARTLFEKYMKAIIPPLHTQILWGNPLKLFFGGRASKNKAVSYDATVIHGNLHSSLQSVLQQPGNQAMAELAFLVKSTDGQRRVVPVPMTFMPQYHVTQGWQATERILPDTQSRFSMVRSPDAFGRLKHRLQSVPDDVKVQCVSDPDDEQHPLSESAVSDLYLRADRIYEQRIHHSEVGLADHLENLTTIGEIITKLLQNAVEFPIGSKVYAVVLNIASKFYLCANCRMTLLGLQNPEKSEFLRNLTDKLQHAGFRTPVHRSLPMVTLFSAKIPYPRGTVKTSEQQHSDLEVDPRRYSSNNLILQADPESLNKLTSFNSRKG
ncbi:MAG: ankyrin repeat domain-containing protein, partial [Proteobacteria bacterium]|nr:ankyrin repeat domain-containing protein [Pseudomonadota bacterium]